jgi:antitoxin MazE
MLKERAVRSRVVRCGNSLGVRIPGSFAQEVGLEDRSEIELRLDEGRIVVEPLRPAPALHELLAGVTPQNVHHDLDWCPLGGLEVG